MPEEQIRGMMHQALNWFLNAVDHTAQK